MSDIQTNPDWLKDIKSKIAHAQIRAALAASRELILFYWELGESITIKIAENNWGAKVIDQLSKDLKAEFPGIQGFSRTNLYYIKQFYEYFSAFTDTKAFVPRIGGQNEIVSQAGATTMLPIVPLIAGQLPWSKIKIILDKFLRR